MAGLPEEGRMPSGESSVSRVVVVTGASSGIGSFADRRLPWLSERGNLRYRDRVLAQAPQGGPGT
jgi:hypothetical protein